MAAVYAVRVVSSAYIAMVQIAQRVFDAELASLLSRSGLPVADLGADSIAVLFSATENSEMCAVCGIECLGSVGLLRSLAVDERHRDRGIGHALVRHVESWAATQGVKDLYLLTTTAVDFFARLGYESVPRAEAPPAIAQTTQFSSLCPTSSAFMRKTLTPPC